MRLRTRTHESDESEQRFEIEWPAAELEIDDEAFARAIAEGRKTVHA